MILNEYLIGIRSNRYLAIVGALASEADYVFFPESPPPTDWPEKLCKKLEQARFHIINFYIHTFYKLLSSLCHTTLTQIILRSYYPSKRYKRPSTNSAPRRSPE